MQAHRIIRVAALTALALVFGERAATAVTINFDTQNFGDLVTTQYPEVTFSADPGYETSAMVTTTTTSPPVFICSRPVGGGFPACENETILDFTNPVYNLTFKSVGTNNSGVVAKVDVQTTYLNGPVTVNIFKSPNLIDLSSFGTITRIRIHSINDHLGIGWDDFSFDVVPEPGSAGLMILGGFGLITRKKGRVV
ncbi:MAG: hypothetical protein Kow00105_13970 [Phycisphaeraceae bacterium]